MLQENILKEAPRLNQEKKLGAKGHWALLDHSRVN